MVPRLRAERLMATSQSTNAVRIWASNADVNRFAYMPLVHRDTSLPARIAIGRPVPIADSGLPVRDSSLPPKTAYRH
jgi:hypothetical protein